MPDEITSLDDRIDILKWTLVTLRAIHDGPDELGKDDMSELKQSCKILIPDIERMISDFARMVDGSN